MTPYYDHGGVTVYQGDSLAVLRDLPDDSVDLVLTDPPYSSGGMFRSDRMADTRAKYVDSSALHDLADFAGDNRDQRGYLAWCSLWLCECLRIVKHGRACVVFTDWRQLPTTSDALQAGGFIWRGIGIWDKQAGRPMPGISNGHAEYFVWGTRGPLDLGHDVYLPTIMTGSTPRGDDRLHQTQKSLGLMERLVELCPPGGTVLDPFAGSGTTLLAARNRGRKSIGVELTTHYAAVLSARLAQLTLTVEGDAA